MNEPLAAEIGKLDAGLTGVSPLSNLSGEALDALGVLLVVLADNEMFHGLRMATWATGAPTLEAAVACAAVAQDKLGHSRALYPLLDELPLAQVGPAHPADDPRTRYALSYFDQPYDDWSQVVASLNLVGPALHLLFHAASGSIFSPLARRAQHILGEEQLTSVYARSLARDLVAAKAGRASLQRQVDLLLPEVLCWFGPPDEPGFARLLAAELISGASPAFEHNSTAEPAAQLNNEALRQRYVGQVAPLLAELGIQTSLRQSAETGQWAYDTLPWQRWNGRRRRLIADNRLSTITCPWCESPRVEQVGAIGSHLMVSQYICLACRSPFEWIRR
jgi:1,2-phenylacetyl-CoA epoxidase catalytic subunit